MAQSTLNLTAMNAALKELYDGQVVENLVYSDNPFMAMVPKKTDFGGKYKPVPIITGVAQGTAATFSTAQANQTAAEIQSFLLTRVSKYTIAQIDNQTMLASQTDKMSFLEGAKLVVDTALRSNSNAVASSLFRSGTGSIAQIGSVSISGTGPYTNAVTLKNIADVVQFEKNMFIGVSATDGAALGAVVGQVQAIDRIKGIVTLTSAADPTLTWVANSYLSVQGDLNLNASGLAAWIPQTVASSGDSFFGVNRYQDRTRLAGIFYDGSAQSIEEALIDASALCAREGGKPNVAFVSFASYSALEKSLGSKVQYVDMKQGEIAFRGIMINGASSLIKVIPDRNCQAQTAWLLQMDTWALEGLGEVPQILKYGDGLEMLRVSNADAGEVRIGAYYQLRTNAPGWNAQVALSA